MISAVINVGTATLGSRPESNIASIAGGFPREDRRLPSLETGRRRSRHDATPEPAGRRRVAGDRMCPRRGDRRLGGHRDVWL